MAPVDYDALCPGCKKPIGDHTMRGYADCLTTAGFDYELPHEEIPDGPISLPGVQGALVGEVTVASAVIQSAIGPLPCLRFTFWGPGRDPMSRVALDPVNLIMDGEGLFKVARLVNNAAHSANAAAERMRKAS
jgi:hypothetical protein